MIEMTDFGPTSGTGSWVVVVEASNCPLSLGVNSPEAYFIRLAHGPKLS